MAQFFFFGTPQRTLLGGLHGVEAATCNGDVFLVVPPLFQEGVMSQRALWTLSESLAAAGATALRFDWHGTGDSGGTSTGMDEAGLHLDLQLARERLAAARPGGQRLLALRSACLPLLAHASAVDEPVDLVLWGPTWTGVALVSAWRKQHAQQMRHAGRYLRTDLVAGQDELAGFEIGAGFLQQLAGMDGREARLAAGSRVLVATWEDTAEIQAFAAVQRGRGVQVEVLKLEGNDQPAWDDPMSFESQAFPRRSVSQLGQRLVA